MEEEEEEGRLQEEEVDRVSRGRREEEIRIGLNIDCGTDVILIVPLRLKLYRPMSIQDGEENVGLYWKTNKVKSQAYIAYY